MFDTPSFFCLFGACNRIAEIKVYLLASIVSSIFPVVFAPDFLVPRDVAFICMQPCPCKRRRRAKDLEPKLIILWESIISYLGK